MELTTVKADLHPEILLFMMSKIQNLNGTHNQLPKLANQNGLFMMSKIQNLNGTHNSGVQPLHARCVVYDVKDTKFEWNSQLPHIMPCKCIRCL